jgi:transcriptional regulator with XRE-family HTH domain
MDRQSTSELADLLGSQLRQLRIEADLTQAQLATRADLGLSTVRGLERGSGTLLSLIRSLRALGRTDWLELLAPEPSVSPIEQLREARGRTARQRVRPQTGSN